MSGILPAIKQGALWLQRDRSPEPWTGSSWTGEAAMSQIQLVASICIMLSVLQPEWAQDCFSSARCCDSVKSDRAGEQLLSSLRLTSEFHQQSAHCQASAKGTVNQRSTSPWRYVDDFDGTRYPAHIPQAECNCMRCISLKVSVGNGADKTYTSREIRGNSVVVKRPMLVFYRKPCLTNASRFHLEPKWYLVNVSCTCVAHHM